MKGILPLSFTIQVIDTTPLYVYVHTFWSKNSLLIVFFLFNSFCMSVFGAKIMTQCTKLLMLTVQ